MSQERHNQTSLEFVNVASVCEWALNHLVDTKHAMVPKKRILFVTGLPGAGKTTLVNELSAVLPQDAVVLVKLDNYGAEINGKWVVNLDTMLANLHAMNVFVDDKEDGLQLSLLVEGTCDNIAEVFNLLKSFLSPFLVVCLEVGVERLRKVYSVRGRNSKVPEVFASHFKEISTLDDAQLLAYIKDKVAKILELPKDLDIDTATLTIDDNSGDFPTPIDGGWASKKNTVKNDDDWREDFNRRYFINTPGSLTKYVLGKDSDAPLVYGGFLFTFISALSKSALYSQQLEATKVDGRSGMMIELTSLSFDESVHVWNNAGLSPIIFDFFEFSEHAVVERFLLLDDENIDYHALVMIDGAKDTDDMISSAKEVVSFLDQIKVPLTLINYRSNGDTK